MSNNIIPLSEIDEKAREIAISWIEELCPGQGMQLPQKHKLASDIMNYHREKALELLTKLLLKKFEKIDGPFRNEYVDVFDIESIFKKIGITEKTKF